MMNDIAYWEVRSPAFVCGWFMDIGDAQNFRLAQARPERYTIHEVNKIVKEND